MIARRTRTAVCAALLAVVAVLGMTALAGWHAAAFDHHARTATIRHADDRDPWGDSRGDPSGDPDDAIHVAAHVVGHAFDLPAHAAPPAPVAAVLRAWPAGESVARAGTDPASPLRPPRG